MECNPRAEAWDTVIVVSISVTRVKKGSQVTVSPTPSLEAGIEVSSV